MTKTVKQLQPLLGFQETSVFSIEVGLLKLSKAFQDLVEGLGRVEIDGPLTVTNDKFMHGLATMNLPLTGTQAPKERFDVVIGAVTFRPGVACEQTRPALSENLAEVIDHRRIVGMLLGMLFQLCQEIFDLFLDGAARGLRLTRDVRWIQPSFQLHQPSMLVLELPMASGKGLTAVHHRAQLRQERMPPFS